MDKPAYMQSGLKVINVPNENDLAIMLQEIFENFRAHRLKAVIYSE
jgi:hypothetical protein